MKEVKVNNRGSEKILPAFIDHIKYSIIEIKSSLLLQDSKELITICHKTKKYCLSYGFESLSEYFKKLEKFALYKKYEEMKESLKETEEYLATLSQNSKHH